MKYWLWLLERLKGRLWWKAVLFGVLGVVTALVATFAGSIFRFTLPFDVSSEAVESLLSIIASSMLAVTTFSLGAVTSAFGGAASNVTPRATRLLMEDQITHNVLSTFIGTFIFSIVGIITLKTGSYGEEGRAVLFVITIAVIAVIVAQLLRWVNHLMVLGRVGATIDRVEDVTAAAMKSRLEEPYLGARLWRDADQVPQGRHAVGAPRVGYLQFINVEALNRLCKKNDMEIWLPLSPGSFCYQGTVLMWASKPVPEALCDDLIKQFIISVDRTYTQDPRFGLAVLCEVASRALSPATNDPGTALDIIARQTRLLTLWAEGRERTEVTYPHLHMVALSDADLFEDAFMLLARDGAHLIEIQLRLQKSLQALQTLGSPSFKAAARQQAEMAAERARSALKAPCDLTRLEAVLERQAGV